MPAIYLLIPIGLVVMFIAICFFFWAVNGKQFTDLDSPSKRIIMDDQQDYGANKNAHSLRNNKSNNALTSINSSSSDQIRSKQSSKPKDYKS